VILDELLECYTREFIRIYHIKPEQNWVMWGLTIEMWNDMSLRDLQFIGVIPKRTKEAV